MTTRATTNRKISLRHTMILAAFGFVGQTLVPAAALAFQSHPAPEGLYAHQFAHVFFLIAMIFLAYWLEYNKLTLHRGWRLIQAACVLFISLESRGCVRTLG